MTAKKKKTEKKAAAKKKKVLKPYQDEKQLREMYLKNKQTAGQIARANGVSRSSVLHHLRKFKIPLWSRTSPKAGKRRDDVDRSFHKKQFLEKKLKEGLSIYRIATECNCSFMQVRHMVEKHGLLELAQQMKAKKEVKKPAVKKKKEMKIKKK